MRIHHLVLNLILAAKGVVQASLQELDDLHQYGFAQRYQLLGLPLAH